LGVLFYRILFISLALSLAGWSLQGLFQTPLRVSFTLLLSPLAWLMRRYIGVYINIFYVVHFGSNEAFLATETSFVSRQVFDDEE